MAASHVGEVIQKGRWKSTYKRALWIDSQDVTSIRLVFLKIDKKSVMKLNIQLITAAILSIGGLIMLFCGVYIDPQGQIHETLLVGFGEVATFAGAIMGVDYSYKHKNNQDQ